MTLSGVTFVAVDCSDAKTLIGMINVGSTALAYYNNVPVSCCNLLISLSEVGVCLLPQSQITFCAIYGWIPHVWCVCWTCWGSMLVFVKGGLYVSRHR
jgi:hypothetical protein